ncbi:MAG TPA: efflux RND transporter periplasmic adaptor subunit [Opitutaceae bacterium]|nr:efflux RND transporter periplasmic adaptor subunit [Opitutaceae bacterium]
MKTNTLSLLSAALLATAVAGCARHDSPAPAAPAAPSSGGITLTAEQRQRLHIAKLAAAPFHRTITTTGTVAFDADRSASVIAPISGPVTRTLVHLGAKVRAGAPLALVASPDYATAVAGYRKALVTAENLRRIANLDRQLFAADALARRDLEQAQTDAVNAEADRDTALQQLRSIGVPESTIKDIQAGRPTKVTAGVIRAPIAGTIVERLISPGQLLQAGTTPCFTIADLSRVWVMADIYESDLGAVAVGDAAEIHTAASPAGVAGKVDNIAAILDPNTRSVAVRVVADNPDDVLKKGMYVRVVIRSRRATSGLLVPTSAVLRDHENLPFVYLAQPDGSFVRRRVTLGSQLGDRYEITAGLNPGDNLVEDGGLFVQFEQNQ